MMFGMPIAITGGVFQIRAIGARATVVVENGEALLIDAGLRGSSGTILQGLETLGLFPEQIGMVVITHAHPDHSGGLSRLVAGREIAVAVHRLEADIIAGTTGPPSPLQNGLIGKMTQPVFSRLMGSPVPVDDRFEDGATLFPSGPKCVWSTFPDTPRAALPSTCQTKGPSSLETHCSTSSPAHSARRRLESPSDRRRLCGRLRSSWAWTSIPCASVTSLPCVRSLAKLYEGSFNNMLHDWCGG